MYNITLHNLRTTMKFGERLKTMGLLTLIFRMSIGKEWMKLDNELSV